MECPGCGRGFTPGDTCDHCGFRYADSPEPDQVAPDPELDQLPGPAAARAALRRVAPPTPKQRTRADRRAGVASPADPATAGRTVVDQPGL